MLTIMWKDDACRLQSSNPPWTYETDLGALLDIQRANKTIPSGAHVHVQPREPDSLSFAFTCIRFANLPFFCCRKPAERTQPSCLAGDRMNQRQRSRGVNDARLSHFFFHDWTTSHCGRMINPSWGPRRLICFVRTVTTDLWQISVDLNVSDKHSFKLFFFLTTGCSSLTSVQWMDG